MMRDARPLWSPERGSTQRDRVKAIDQVERLCGRLQEEFGAGSLAGAVTSMIVVARNQIQAAKGRLRILQSGLVAMIKHAPRENSYIVPASKNGR
jgi:hypothetical protein